MCFRPAEAELPPVKCPDCGRQVNRVGGALPKKCPFCESSLEEFQATGTGAAMPKAAVAPRPAAMAPVQAAAMAATLSARSSPQPPPRPAVPMPHARPRAVDGDNIEEERRKEGENV